MDIITLVTIGTGVIGALAGATQIADFLGKRKNRVLPDLSAEPTALSPLDAAPPLPRNQLVGRDEDVARVCELLLQKYVGLVTLTGAGGTGKTRLSLQVAESIKAQFADGVAYIELSSVADPNLVASSIAQTLDVKESTGRPVIETLKTRLLDKQLLLVIDNFEHLLAAAREIEQLIVSCPRIKILVTSRRRLNISDEHEYQVPPLTFPQPAEWGLMDFNDYSAVQLFIERAQAVDRSFTANTEDLAEIARICRRLDGLPLAIELAAARIKYFKTVSILCRQLVNPSGHLEFDVLTEGDVNLESRQRTLEATIGWSYNLLHEAERQFLRNIAVFSAGCTLQSAQYVTQSKDAWSHLGALVEWNLLTPQQGIDGETRFVLLETIREYALNLSVRNAKEHQRTERRFTDYFLDQAEAIEPHLAEAGLTGRMRWFRAEQDNMRTALSWAFANDSQTALRLAYSLSGFWNILGQLNEERAALNRALDEAVGVPVKLIMRVLGRAAGRQNNTKTARQLAEKHLQLSSETHDLVEQAWALQNLGNITRLEGNLPLGRELLEQALVLFRQLSDNPGMAMTLLNLCVVAVDQADLSAARKFVQESLDLNDQLDNRGDLPIARAYLAFLTHKDGEHDRCNDLIEKSLAMMREDNRLSWLPWALHWKGRIATDHRELQTARDALTESLTIFQKNEDTGGKIRSLLAFSWLTAAEGLWERAITLLAAEEVQRQKENSPPAPDWTQEIRSIEAGAWANLGDANVAIAYKVGEAMSLAQAVTYATETKGIWVQ